MSKAIIPFARPCVGPEEEAQVLECLRNGWLTSGAKMREFEQAVLDYVMTDPTTEAGLQSIALNSATAGLHLALP